MVSAAIGRIGEKWQDTAKDIKQPQANIEQTLFPCVPSGRGKKDLIECVYEYRRIVEQYGTCHRPPPNSESKRKTLGSH